MNFISLVKNNFDWIRFVINKVWSIMKMRSTLMLKIVCIHKCTIVHFCHGSIKNNAIRRVRKRDANLFMEEYLLCIEDVFEPGLHRLTFEVQGDDQRTNTIKIKRSDLLNSFISNKCHFQFLRFLWILHSR